MKIVVPTEEESAEGIMKIREYELKEIFPDAVYETGEILDSFGYIQSTFEERMDELGIDDLDQLEGTLIFIPKKK